jgi:hypothetical protein
MIARDVVRFHHPTHEKSRTGVVIFAQEEWLLVIYGRGTPFEEERVEVKVPSSAASQIDLYKTTYFYARSVARVRRTVATRVGHCPPDVFLRLRALFQKGIRNLTTIA